MEPLAEFQIVSAPRFSASEMDVRLYDNLVAQKALWNHLMLQVVRENDVSVELRFAKSKGELKVCLRLHGQNTPDLQKKIDGLGTMLPPDFRWLRTEPDLSFDGAPLRMARIVRRLEYLDLPVPSMSTLQGGGSDSRPLLNPTGQFAARRNDADGSREIPTADTGPIELLVRRFCLPLPGVIEEMKPRQRALFQEIQRCDTAIISVCVHPMRDKDRPECQRIALSWKRFLDPFAAEIASSGFATVQSLRAAYDRFSLPPSYLVHCSIRVAGVDDESVVGLANIAAVSLGGVKAFQVFAPTRTVNGAALYDRARDVPSLMPPASQETLRGNLRKTMTDAGIIPPDDVSLIDFILYTPHLFTIEEAGQLVRLPLADDEGLPGFNSDVLPPFSVPSLNLIPVNTGESEISPPPPNRIRIGMLRTGGLAARIGQEELYANQAWHSLDPIDLTKHALIVGSTGSGKTMTTLFLVRELIRLDVPVTIIEPVKTEYYAHLRKLGLPNLRRFRFEGRSPKPEKGTHFLIFDPMRVPFGISVVRHCSYIKSCFEAAFPMDPVLALLFENAIHDYYTSPISEGGCGLNKFNRGGPEIGRIIDLGGQKKVYPSFATFKEFVLGTFIDREFTTPTSGGNNRAQDVKDIFRRRLINLANSVVGESFRLADELYIDKKGDPSYYDVLSGSILTHQVVVELDAIPDASQKALVMAFLLTYLFEFRQAEDLFKREADKHSKPKLRHFLIVEEAHRLLASGPTGGRGMDVVGESSQSKAVSLFVDLLAEIRAYGQGLAIVEQIPTKIVPEAVKNTNLKIMLRLTAKDDREYLGEAMNFTDAQMRFVTNLKVDRRSGNEHSAAFGQINFVVFDDGIEQPLLLSLPLRAPGSENSHSKYDIETENEPTDQLYSEFFE